MERTDMTEKTEAALRQVLKFQYKWQEPQITDFLRQVRKAEDGR